MHKRFEEEMIMPFCPNCGTNVDDKAAFCANCGQKIEPIAPAAPAEPTVAPAYEAPVAPAYEAPVAPAYEQPAAPAYDPAYQGYQPYQEPFAPAPQKKSKKGLWIGLGCGLGGTLLIIILIIILAGGGGGSSSPARANPADKLSSAYNIYCDYSYADLAYDGSYLSIDTNPNDIDDYFNSSAWSAIQSVNTYLGLPASVEEQMRHTRALDGRQTITHGNYTVTWTYHPDDGLEVMYTVNSGYGY